VCATWLSGLPFRALRIFRGFNCSLNYHPAGPLHLFLLVLAITLPARNGSAVVPYVKLSSMASKDDNSEPCTKEDNNCQTCKSGGPGSGGSGGSGAGGSGGAAGAGPGGNNCTSCQRDGGRDNPSGAAKWSVTEPVVNLWLDVDPLLHPTSEGQLHGFKLYFKNYQGTLGDRDNANAKIFSIGARWHTPWRSYLEATSTNFFVFRGDGSAREDALDMFDYNSRTMLTQVGGTNELRYRSGAKRVYGQVFANSTTNYYFLTRWEDPNGRATQFVYVTNAGVLRLDKVLDVDNKATTFHYTTVNGFDLIDQVTNPYG